MLSRVLSLVVAAVMAGTVSAGVYKWTDAQGNVHYGDRRPAGAAEEIDLPEAAPVPAPAQTDREQTRQRMLDSYREDREKKKQAAEEHKRQRKELEARCTEARDRLRTYQESSLYDLLPNGERRFLSQGERAKAIADLEQDIKRYCRR